MAKLEADVIVIGGGASGITAAVAAAEKDASVIVIEKGKTTGGAANMGMGLFAVESKYQKAQLVDFTKEDAYNFLMEFTHHNTNSRLVRRYIEQSGETIDWLEAIGVQFLGSFKYFEGSKQTWHIVKTAGSNLPAERAASNMFKALTDRARELEVDILFETKALKIVTEDGHVTGVEIEHPDGSTEIAESSAVIVASGGFGDNPDMIKKIIGLEWGKNLFSFRIPGIKGEGLNMMWDSGAGENTPVLEQTYTIPGVTDVFKTVSETMRQPILMVNLDGKRFINEEKLNNPVYTGNAIRRQKLQTGFTIIDESVLDYYRKKGLDYITVHHNVKTVDHWEKEVSDILSGKGSEAAEEGSLGDLSAGLLAKDFFYAADSIEELCEKTGIDEKGLKETIAQYNEFVAEGDQDFFKHQKYMHPMTGGRVYAAQHYPCGYGTLGGVNVTDCMEVLDGGGDKIPGLYSCGTDACGIFGDTYCFYLPGNTMGFAVNSGRIAGYEAVDYIDSDDFVE
ncbi:MAG: FAD-dependent oxidoreductase [Clostridiales Family XIII bacterium]|nr:FAD-dependent oxidoreductase [Clostridiales Family XIII bacterium]